MERRKKVNRRMGWLTGGKRKRRVRQSKAGRTEGRRG